MRKLKPSQNQLKIIKKADLGLITLKSNLSDPVIRSSIKALAGVGMPSLGAIKFGKKYTVGWMAPDELIIMSKQSFVRPALSTIKKRIGQTHHLCANVSDSRSCFQVLGTGWRDVLAKGTPANVADDSFKIGTLIRSRIGSLAAAFWTADGDGVNILCFKSGESFMLDWLTNASKSNSLPDFL